MLPFIQNLSRGKKYLGVVVAVGVRLKSGANRDRVLGVRKTAGVFYL